MSSGWRKRRDALMLAPLYVWTLLLVAIPMGYVFVMSFSSRGETYGISYVFSTEAYRALMDPTVISVILSSLRIGALTTLVTMLVAYPFASIMANRTGRWKNLMLLLVIVPFWTNALLRTYGWMIFLRANGFLNAFLLGVGFTEEPIKFLYNLGAVLFGMVYSFLPFMILPIYSSIEKLDKGVHEAAKDLGAGKLRVFFTITLPLTLPGIVSGCVMVFVPSVGMFFISDLMGGGTNMLLGNLINHALHGGRNWPLGAVLSMVMVVMTFLTISVYRRFSDGGDLGVF